MGVGERRALAGVLRRSSALAFARRDRLLELGDVLARLLELVVGAENAAAVSLAACAGVGRVSGARRRGRRSSRRRPRGGTGATQQRITRRQEPGGGDDGEEGSCSRGCAPGDQGTLAAGTGPRERSARIAPSRASFASGLEPVRRRRASQRRTHAEVQLPELPYDYSALEPHSRLRCSSCTTASTTRPTSTAPTPPSRSSAKPASSGDFGTINQLEKNMAFHLSGHVLHSLFWTEHVARRRGRARGRAGGGDEGELRVVRRPPGADERGGEQRPGLRVGRHSRGSRSRAGSSSNRSTTTRATSARAAPRCSCSTCGSTRTTSSTRT